MVFVKTFHVFASTLLKILDGKYAMFDILLAISRLVVDLFSATLRWLYMPYNAFMTLENLTTIFKQNPNKNLHSMHIVFSRHSPEFLYKIGAKT